MATVKQLLDDLAAGRKTVQEVAADFRTRQWPARQSAATLEQAQLGADDEPDDNPNSWAAVEVDHRVSNEDYKTLLAAQQQARRN